MNKQEEAISYFLSDIQKDIIPSLREFGDRLGQVDGISEQMLSDYSWIFKRLKWSFEQTADTLNGQE